MNMDKLARDISTTDIRLMRGWLDDCDYEWRTGEPVEDLEDDEVLDLIAYNYSGGIDQFIMDTEDDTDRYLNLTAGV